MQQDPVEWEQQSSDMGLVYANAKCVISGTASEDSTGGCFKPREFFRDDCTLLKHGPKQLIVVAEHGMPNLAELFDEKVKCAPLTTRGWTFQERFLAKRVLHCSAGHFLFEYNDLMASEYENEPYVLRTNIRLDGKEHETKKLADIARQKPITNTHITREVSKPAVITTIPLPYSTPVPGGYDQIEVMYKDSPEKHQSTHLTRWSYKL